MKRYIYNKVEKTLKGLFLLLAVALFAPALTSCSDDDDSQSTPMTITGIYLQDVDAEDGVTDRLVEFARLGNLVRIEGTGFNGLKAIYINGYDTYFNNALMTDNNVWVTLDEDTPIEDAEEDVRNTIQLIKDNTSYTHSFTIRAASPSASRIDNTLAQAGETVTVYGSNLHETTTITLPDGTVVTSGIEIGEDGDWYSFTMPSGYDSSYSGSIVSEGAHGTAKTPPYFYFNSCYVINYDGLGTFTSWSATYTEEELEQDPLNSGRGTCVMIIPQSRIDEGGVKSGVTLPGFWTAGNDDADDDWNRMTSYIPGTVSTDSVALQFDVYVPEEWDLTGQVEITIQNNLSTYGYGSADTQPSSDYLRQAYAWVPWLDRETGEHEAFTTGDRWETITIPLSEFGNYTDTDTDWTFQNVIDDKNSGSYRNFGVLFTNVDLEYSDDIVYSASVTTQEIYLDNFRIVPCNTITVSDY